jgi:hypothetical protein
MKITDKLTEAQKEYIVSFYSGQGPQLGSPLGLVRRGFLGYAWGMDNQHGYKKTKRGEAAYRAIIAAEQRT